MKDFLFRGSIEKLDPALNHLINLETERQNRKLIMIASESSAPNAVREALGSTFQNIYAEGYPNEQTRWQTEDEILDYSLQLNYYRRYADPRYYKGVEYADIVESLARRRCAELFSTDQVHANQLFINVQPLSGAPANNAVYTATINPGDTILGMNLLHGGHLTHGSPVNRSGKLYKSVHYNVDSTNEKLNYESIQETASECKPKIIIAGYSSYPWVPDWEKFRKIADSVGALLLADISHIAGLVAAKQVPSPIGYAHIVTFTTHKTLCGPRGAVILTTEPSLSRKIDRAVFPGEQGGPHVHVFAALALAFLNAKSTQFQKLQSQIIKNCSALAVQLQKRGFRLPFGGTDTHLLNVDCKTIVGQDGTQLTGDMAARILDIAGIVLNRNTIPGDKTALHASGIRMGTPWLTQRGLMEPEMVQIADIIADVLHSTKPYTVESRGGPSARAKIDFFALEKAKSLTRQLAADAGKDEEYQPSCYPHHYFLDDVSVSKSDITHINIEGEHASRFVNFAFTSLIDSLDDGQACDSNLVIDTNVIKGELKKISSVEFQFSFSKEYFGLCTAWLRALSDGYIEFNPDITMRLPGPVNVYEAKEVLPTEVKKSNEETKPFYIGKASSKVPPLPEFSWSERLDTPQRRTPLFQEHVKLGAKMTPFAGWEMPVWYSSVLEEHLATRQYAGLFDVSHMGVYQAEGLNSASFLDSVCGNDVSGLDIGESCYTHFLDPHANVLDDCLVYRRSNEKYLIVVNASNDEKDWNWLNAVLKGKVLVDIAHPGAKAFGIDTRLRNLRDPKEGNMQKVDIALQGPRSRDILLSLGCSEKTRDQIMGLKRTQLCDATVGGFDLIVSRTGYTGEKMAFELFVHPDKAVSFWRGLLEHGKDYGLKPCGLGARDSLRTEAGLPLYGHEMAGDMGLGVAEAGFGSYVKVYKPWFIGRNAYINREKKRTSIVMRFRFAEKAVRMAHHGDPILDTKGKVIGHVTSCAVDMDGYLTGQAFVDLKSANEGTEILIYQKASSSTQKAPEELITGDRIILPSRAIIISRFPKL